MIFDFTHGKRKAYLVTVYNHAVEDRLYYHYLKDAKKAYDEFVSAGQEPGTIVSMYDFTKKIIRIKERKIF